MGVIHTHTFQREGHIYAGLAKRWSIQSSNYLFPLPTSRRPEDAEWGKEQERVAHRKDSKESAEVPFESSIDY